VVLYDLVLLRFNTNIRQIEAEIDLSYRTVRRRVERSGEALDAPSITLSGPVEIDEMYVSAGLKGPSATRGRARVDCLRVGEDHTSATNRQCSRWSIMAWTYDLLEDDDSFTRKYVGHGDGEYADGEVHVNGYESCASLARQWLSPHRGVSKDQYLTKPVS